MTSTFTVHDASGYEQLMGRWSKKLAPKFIEFTGLEGCEKALWTSAAAPEASHSRSPNMSPGEISAIDYSPVFVQSAQQRNTDPRISIQEADACALPFGDGSFDGALAMLVLHFVPEAGKAVAEMRRVVRKDGVVGAVVWDHLGGMSAMRMMVDTVAVLFDGGRQLRSRYVFQPMMQPGEIKQTFLDQGLVDVTETELMIRMNYKNFDDYWAPMAAGEGPLGKFVSTLDPAQRARTDSAMRDAYEAGRPDGPRSFSSVAWACRGVVQ